MFLYHSTLQPPTAIYGAVVGKFISSTGPATSLVVQRGSSWIELLVLDDQKGTLSSVHRQCLFCTVRSLASLHEPASGKDLLVVGTDAGRLILLEWSPGTSEWRTRVRETYGRSGVRRTIPGQYLACDPQGRALMIGAVERQKLVYLFSHHDPTQTITQAQALQQRLQSQPQPQSLSNTLRVSSPLEVSKTGLLVMAMAALDTPYGNPMFVTIEIEGADDGGEEMAEEETAMAMNQTRMRTRAQDEERERSGPLPNRDGAGTTNATPAIDPTDACQGTLAFYEVDTGLHQVTRKAAIPLPRAANQLLALPGGEGEPGGVLVAAAGGHVSWHRLGHEPTALVIRRADAPVVRSGQGIEPPFPLFTGAVVVRAREGEASSYCLLQTEEGDLIKVTVDAHTSSLTASYYDTVPLASTMVILPSGLLFLSSEHGPTHRLYQVPSFVGPTGPADPSRRRPGDDRSPAITFTRSSDLQHLTLVDQLDNYGMLTGLLASPSVDAAGPPQLMATQGRGLDSRLIALQRGLSITNVTVSEMPTVPATGIWTLPLRGGEHVRRDAAAVTALPTDLIVIALADATTLVLRVEEGGVQQVDPADTALLLEGTLTLAMGMLADGSTVQVHSSGVRQVRPDGRLCEWRAPTGSAVQVAATNERQVILALSTRRLVHLEADQSGVLLETGQTDPLAWDILSLALGSVPEGALRCRYLAMGTADLVVRIVDCDPGEDHLSPLATQAVAAAPEGLAISGTSGSTPLMLHVGLANGVYCRLMVDAASGALKDARVRFLGTGEAGESEEGRGVRRRGLIRVQSIQSPSSIPTAARMGGGVSSLASPFVVMVLSKGVAPWLGFLGGVSVSTPAPASTASLDYSMAPLVMEGDLTAVAPFSSSQCPWGGFVGVSGNRLHIFMVESLTERFALADEGLALSHTPRRTASHGELLAVAESDHCALSSPSASSSSIRLVLRGQTVAIHHLREQETITCITFVSFHDRPAGELYLAVGAVKDMCLMPRSAAAAVILLFRLQQEDHLSPTLSLLHTTALDESQQLPSAMCMLGGRLLCGVGNVLRLYDLGKRQLLRKCEIRTPTFSTALATSGWRVFVGDARYSVLVYQYQPADNRFILLADDVQPRPITSLLTLDYETVAVADRMGSLAVLRLPGRLATDLEDGVALGSALPKREHLYGAPFKMERLVEFYVGETIVSLLRSSLGPSINGTGKEAILYGTISGALGALMPLAQRRQALTLQTLEMRMREEAPGTLVGRSHLMHRSYYAAVKSVIDGDLCQMYSRLCEERQHQVAGALEMAPTDVLRQLEELQVLLGL